MVILYWDIGASILERQQTEGWGAKVIDRISFDLKEAFPDQILQPRNHYRRGIPHHRLAEEAQQESLADDAELKRYLEKKMR